MGQTALVTGSAPRAGEVASALEAAGYAVTTVEDPSKLDDLSLEGASVDCYVQLPVEIAPRGDDVVRLIADFLSRGLLARFTSAATVSPALAPHACVVLVTGNHPPKASTPDDQGARLALLKLLAHAILAEHHDDGVRAVIVDHGRSAEEIVELVTAPAAGQFRVIHEYAGLAPEMNYADWRLEILALSEGQA
jgi:hypothetical protein